MDVYRSLGPKRAAPLEGHTSFFQEVRCLLRLGCGWLVYPGGNGGRLRAPGGLDP